MSTGYDSEATFQPRNTYSGGSRDWLGFDDGARSLPAEIPRDRPLRTGEVSDAMIESAGESFANVWSIRQRTAYPALGVGATIGDTLRLGERKLGYLATVNLSRRDRVRVADVAAVRLEG